jgi:hypothetical protein
MIKRSQVCKYSLSSLTSENKKLNVLVAAKPVTWETPLTLTILPSFLSHYDTFFVLFRAEEQPCAACRHIWREYYTVCNYFDITNRECI